MRWTQYAGLAEENDRDREWKKKSKKSPLSHTGAFGSPVGWPLIGKVSQEMLVTGHPSQTQQMC